MTYAFNDALLEEKVIGRDSFDEASSFLKLQRLRVKLPNGKESIRDMVCHPGASAMLVLDEKGEIVLERQWRAPLNRAFWEIPAGKLDFGEDPLAAAKRELTEETGLVAKTWNHLGTLHNAIGYSNEVIEIYLARDLTQAKQHLDDNEFIYVTKVPLQEAYAMAKRGEITDAKTLAALFWLRDFAL